MGAGTLLRWKRKEADLSAGLAVVALLIAIVFLAGVLVGVAENQNFLGSVFSLSVFGFSVLVQEPALHVGMARIP